MWKGLEKGVTWALSGVKTHIFTEIESLISTLSDFLKRNNSYSKNCNYREYKQALLLRKSGILHKLIGT